MKWASLSNKQKVAAVTIACACKMPDETFGPIFCVIKVKDESEAINTANASRYGSGGS